MTATRSQRISGFRVSGRQIAVALALFVCGCDDRQRSVTNRQSVHDSEDSGPSPMTLDSIIQQNDVVVLERQLQAYLTKLGMASNFLRKELTAAGFVEVSSSLDCKVLTRIVRTGDFFVREKFISVRLCHQNIEVQAAYRSV